MQESYRPALELVQRHLRAMDPALVAERSGAELARGEGGDEFRLRLLNRDYRVPISEMLVYDAATASPAGVSATLVILHYLEKADGSPIRREWIPFRDLPGGNVYQQAFRQQCLDPLTAAFGRGAEAFRSSGQGLGGVPGPMGDASFIFRALPRLPMACVLWLADEEQGAEANLLYDAVAPRYLPTEDLAALGRMLAFGLVRFQRRKP